MSAETPISFQVAGDRLIGILHEPQEPARRGVIIVVGGPQYRVGAHRQFVHLARALAARGIAVLRFDYRGMGDSEGEFRGFEFISEDMDAALAAMQARVPSLTSVTLWGLCDAASAILMKPDLPPVVTGLVVLNPWVRTSEGEARAFVRHYYLRRLLSADFWKKLLTGKVRAGRSLMDLGENVRQGRKASSDPLPQRVYSGLQSASRPVLLILSGDDLVAREFEDGSQSLLRKTTAGLQIARLPAADHTFSKRAWKDEIATLTGDWVLAREDA